MNSLDINPLNNKKLYQSLMTIDPIHSNLAKNLRKKLWLAYMTNRAKAFLVNSDFLDLKDMKSKDTPNLLDFVPTILICSYLINGVSILLQGGPGSGKTTIAKIMNKMLTGYPITKLEDTIIRCDSELSKEQLIGYLDLGELMGSEHKMVVIWSPWIQSYDEGNIGWIVDEVNQAPPRIQSMLHSIMAERIIKYQFQSKFITEYRLIMSENPITNLDSTGKFPKSMSFLSRIWIKIPVKQASAPDLAMINDLRKDRKAYNLELDSIVPKILTLNELRIASILASRIPISNEAEKFITYLTRETNICIRAPRYDKTLCETVFPGQGLCTTPTNCHFYAEASICKKILGGSARESLALTKFGQALAFFIGEEGVSEVQPYHIRAIAPYILSHKCYIPQSVLKKEEHFFGDIYRFVDKNYVQYCYEKIENRRNIEIAFRNLFRGNGSEQDLNLLISASSSDLYVMVDLLPKVAQVDFRSDRTAPEVLSSVLDESYCKFMRTIIEIDEDGTKTAEEKAILLTNIIDQINKSSETPFRINLLDKIYVILNKNIKQIYYDDEC